MDEQEARESGMTQDEYYEQRELARNSLKYPPPGEAEQCDCGAWCDINGYCPSCDY